MKVLKTLGKLLLGLPACAVLLFLVTLAVNWNDRPPSAQALRLSKLIAERPQVSDADNAYVYLLGFNAPAGEDPVTVGKERRDWLESTVPTHYDSDDDPLGVRFDFGQEDDSAEQALKKACRDDDRKTCADAFETLALVWRPSSLDALALARYGGLLARRGLREVVPFDLHAPLPAYSDALSAQRLAMLVQWQNARAGRLEEVHRFLSADFDFWRTQQRSASQLISKMIAVAALRNHFLFSNLILRQVPAEQVLYVVPGDWSRALAAEERSMLLVMAGEVAANENLFMHLERGDFDATGNQPVAERHEDRPVKWAIYGFIMRFFQKQDQLNFYAARHARMADEFSVPIDHYQEVEAALRKLAESETRGMRVYNPIGHYMRDKAGDGTEFFGYPRRVASVEGMRRAALLVQQLRARRCAAEDVPEELQRAELRDPYTLAAFEWDASRRSIVFDDRGDHRWHRNEYFY